MKRVALLSAATGLVLACHCQGHGTHATIETDSRVVVSSYDDGSPMDGCDVSVYSPTSGDTPWLTGITDPNGRFAFCPDTQGVWQVVVDDGMGHRVATKLNRDKNMHAERREDVHHHSISMSAGLLVGVGLIFGLFGLITIMKSRGRACISRKE